MNIKDIKGAINQFKTSKEFSSIDDNPRMEKFYELAIETLEKQIPKMAIYKIHEKWSEMGKKEWCPACDNLIDDIERIKYCTRCGQRIKFKNIT